LGGSLARSYLYPELFSFAKNKKITFHKAVLTSPLHNLFHLPLWEQAYAQLQYLTQELDALFLTEDPDIWTYILGSLLYKPAKAYCHLLGHSDAHPVFKWIWKTSCQHKHKVLFWRLFNDRMSTTGLLKGINMDLPSFDSVLCALSHEESLEHLFLRYPFVMACWSSLSLFLVNQEDPFRNLQNSVGRSFLSRSDYSYVLEFMDFKK
jgi:hypothetical protein